MIENVTFRGGIPLAELEAGAGRLKDAATVEGVQLVPDISEVPRISLAGIVSQLDYAGVPSTAHKEGREVEASNLVGKRVSIEGARCVLAVSQNGNKILFPAAAINMGPQDTRIGFVMLATFVDRRDPSNPDSRFAQLTDLQQQLLDTYVIQAKHGTGLSHGEGGLVNAGEIGHGALIASMSRRDVNIHQLTHDTGASRQISRVVSSQASHIYARGQKPRPTGSSVIFVKGKDEVESSGVPVIEKVYFGASSQLDQSIGLNAFHAGVGMVAAVVRTGEVTGADAPRVDLLANMGRIVTPLETTQQAGRGTIHAH